MVDKKVFAFIYDKDVVDKSSSGGAFTAIYDVLLKKYGKCAVYGAVMDKNLNVVHKRSIIPEDIDMFRGSKYVQSDMSNIYHLLKEDLMNDIPVLFTGTPCQTYAVKKFCEKQLLDVKDLYLVDIICHGVASKKVWDKYKSWIENKYKSRLVDFRFRYKASKWRQYPSMAKFENGKTLINTYDVRIYNQLFLALYPLNKGCYSCKFSGLERYTDLTIGDFWGIDKVIPDFPDSNGVSQILVNSDKGEWLLECIERESQNYDDAYLKQCNNVDYLKYQHNLVAPTNKPIRLEKFWEDFNNKEFDYILKCYAGYSLKGKIVHGIKKVCGQTGLTVYIKKKLKK